MEKLDLASRTVVWRFVYLYSNINVLVETGFGQHFKLSLEAFQSKKVFSPNFVLVLCSG